MGSKDGYLNNLLYSTLQNELSPPRVGLRLILNRFAELGITLTDSQIDKLKSDLEDLENENPDKLLVQLNDEQELRLKAVQGKDSATIELNVDDLNDLPARLENSLTQIVPDILQMVSETFLNEWKSQASKVLAEQQSERIGFNDKVCEIWGQAINLLDMLVSVCMEEGARFNNDFREEAARTNDFVFDALTRLHGRGCQVGSEILTLLRNGFADGAHARWRTLHELAVVAMFISEHGQTAAERYLEHSATTSYMEAKQYQRHCNALGYPPLSNKKFQQLKSVRDSLIEKYGKVFAQDYGWAASVLPKNGLTFAAIERSVSLDHLRPFYKLANINVHAGSKGISFRMGSPPRNGNLLLAGSSLFGLADAGQNAAISIHQLTITLLLSKPNLDRLAFAQAIQLLVDEVLVAFIEAHRRLETENAD